MTNVDAFRIVSFSCCCSCALSLSLFSVFIQKNCFKAWKQMFLRGSSLKCIHLSFRQICMAPSDGNRENAHTHTSNSDKYSLLFVRKICLNNNCYKVKSSRAVCCRFLFQFFIFIFNSSIRCIFSGFSNFISLYYFDLFFFVFLSPSVIVCICCWWAFLTLFLCERWLFYCSRRFKNKSEEIKKIKSKMKDADKSTSKYTIWWALRMNGAGAMFHFIIYWYCVYVWKVIGCLTVREPNIYPS